MALPSPGEYRAALVYYREGCLRADPGLAGGCLEMEPGSKFPLTRSGAYAIVYIIRTERARYAVRVFTREVEDIAERYEAMVSFLGGREDALRFIVLPEFRKGRPQEGMFVAGKWCPYLKMLWGANIPSVSVGIDLRGPLGQPWGTMWGW